MRENDGGSASIEVVVLTGSVVFLAVAVIWTILGDGVSMTVNMVTGELASSADALGGVETGPGGQGGASDESGAESQGESGSQSGDTGDGSSEDDPEGQDEAGEGDTESQGGETSPPSEQTAGQSTGATDEEQDPPDEEKSGKPNNGKSGGDHENSGKHLAKGGGRRWP